MMSRKVLFLLAGGQHETAVDGAFQHGHGPRGAVVVKEVIAVNAVFGPVVFFEQGVEPFRLLGRKVELLLHNAAAFIIVGINEAVEVLHAQLIVSLPQDEAPHEVGLVEVEHTVVVHPVVARFVVAQAQRRVAVERIYLLAGAARQQAGAPCRPSTRRRGQEQRQRKENDTKRFFHPGTFVYSRQKYVISGR